MTATVDKSLGVRLFENRSLAPAWLARSLSALALSLRLEPCPLALPSVFKKRTPRLDICGEYRSTFSATSI